MPAIGLRVTAWLRRRKLRLFVTAVLIGVAGGVTMGIAAGTWRTDTAPDRYTRQAGGDPDLVITQLSGQPLNEAVAQLPGVVSTEALVFVPSFLVSPLDGTLVFEPNTFAGDDQAVGTRLVEGRFTDPANPDEFTANRPMASLLAERFGTRVGERFQVVSFDQQQVAANFDHLDEPAVPPFTATLVGITESPNEFDDPSPMMVFSRSFLGAHPDVGVVQTLIAARLDGVAPSDVMDAVRQLPSGGDAYATPLRVVSDSARRAVRLQVTALWLVTALSALAAAVVIAQIVSRALHISDEERQSMLALGWRHRDLAVERAMEAGFVAILAAPIAAAIAYALTAMFPLGELRSFDPDPGVRADWLVTVLGVTIVAAVAIITGAVVGIRRARAAAVHGRVGGLDRAVAESAAGVSLSVGARFASSGAGGRRSWTSLLAGAVGLAGLVGSLVVGLTLARIVDRPERWGVNYDQLFGNPYTNTNADIVTPVIDNPDVIAATGANIGSVTINGSDTATIGFDSAKGSLVPTVLHGRAPLTAAEIGLGAEVVDRLDVDIGDTVEVAGASGDAHQLAVVGIVVTPDSAGNGAAITFEAYRAMNPTATENVVLIDFAEDAPANAIDVVAADNFTPPGALATPTSIRALGRVTAAPFLLGAVLAVVLVTGGGYLLASSVRARRRDLAILRALGSDRRQLRAVVHWQASLVAATIVALGVPLGIVLGRWVVTLLTDALGVVPGVDVPVLGVAGVLGTALLVANALALLPARRASRVGMAQLSLDR